MSKILSRKGATLGVKSLSLSIANMSDELLTRSLKIGLTGDFLPVIRFLDIVKQRKIKQTRESTFRFKYIHRNFALIVV